MSQAANCSFSVSPTTATVAAAGGNGPAISVSAAAGCAWAAESEASWLTVTSGGTGNGNGTVTLAAARNTEAARVGYLTIAGQSVTVTQDAGCLATPTLTPTSFSASGGTALGVVVALLGCSWTATSNADWITVTSATSLLGPGTASFRIDENSGGSRSGTVTLAGQIFTISQAQR